MQKLLYAIQSRQAEEALSGMLQEHGIVTTGSAAYREAIAPSLRESPADILVYRESLKGSTDTFQLMQSLRTEFPRTRIVFISNERSTASTLLFKLTTLAIYDIINSDSPNIHEIYDYIMRPRGFDYASKFYMGTQVDGLAPELPVSEDTSAHGRRKPGLFGGLGGLAEKLAGGGFGGSISVEPAQQPVQPRIPEVDIETMRGAMLEEARRTAQAEIPQLVQLQVEAETASLKMDIEHKDKTLASLSASLKEKTASELSLKHQLEEAIQLRKNTEEQLRRVQIEAEKTNQSYQAQLVNLQSTRPPDWYAEQTKKWMAEREILQGKIQSLEMTIQTLQNELQNLRLERESLAAQLEAKSKELEAAMLSVPRDVSSAMDEAFDDEMLYMPDNESDYRVTPTGEGRVIAFVGTKHGVGNTTVALNTAIALASSGYKTLFIEINRQFPMVQDFFDFSNIVRGLDTAMRSLQANNQTLASQCILKPHGIMTQRKELARTYKRLPGPLHFLLYSNDFLLRCKDNTAPQLDERELKDLLYFLTMKERYSYIVVDLQPDDQHSMNVFLSSSFQVNQLVLTMTQDTHSITTAGLLITTLARGRNSSLVRGAEFIINQYSPNNKMTIGKICKFFHVPESKVNKISLDSKGYMDANYSAVPYSISKGKYSNEYLDLRMKLSR